MGEFLGGVYLGFMGGVVFSIAVALLVVLAGGLLRKKEKGLEIGNVPVFRGDTERHYRVPALERSYHCPALGYGITENGCRFHRTQVPEDCVNCLIPQGETA